MHEVHRGATAYVFFYCSQRSVNIYERCPPLLYIVKRCDLRLFSLCKQRMWYDFVFFSCFPISFKCWTFLHETRSSTAAKMVFARRMLIRANVGTFPIRSSPHRVPSGKNTMVEHCINRRCVCLLCVRKVLPKSNYISHSPTLPYHTIHSHSQSVVHNEIFACSRWRMDGWRVSLSFVAYK